MGSGRVCQKKAGKVAKKVLRMYHKKFTTDVKVNKRIVAKYMGFTKKRVTRIAGMVTHFMKRLKKGPVKGIVLDESEEEDVEEKNTNIPQQSIPTRDSVVVSDTVMTEAERIPGTPKILQMDHTESEEKGREGKDTNVPEQSAPARESAVVSDTQMRESDGLPVPAKILQAEDTK